MSFEQLWTEIEKTKRLPGMTFVDMPSVLCPETKKMLAKSGKSVDELLELLSNVIDAINNGSIEKVDVLVQRNLTSEEN